jgi:hypothetical protein
MQAPKLKIEINIFKDAQFWFSKGHTIQNAKNLEDNSDSVALDYYLSGIKIDP